SILMQPFSGWKLLARVAGPARGRRDARFARQLFSFRYTTTPPMLPFKLIYSNDYYLPIGTHVFPAQKYRLVQQQLLKEKIAGHSDFVEPRAASDEDILLVHTPEYVNKLKKGTL